MHRGRLERLGSTKLDEKRADVTLENESHVTANANLIG